MEINVVDIILINVRFHIDHGAFGNEKMLINESTLAETAARWHNLIQRSIIQYMNFETFKIMHIE